jgi:hypothetical protein
MQLQCSYLQQAFRKFEIISPIHVSPRVFFTTLLHAIKEPNFSRNPANPSSYLSIPLMSFDNEKGLGVSDVSAYGTK